MLGFLGLAEGGGNHVDTSYIFIYIYVYIYIYIKAIKYIISRYIY